MTKPKTQTIVMAKIPQQYEGMDCYCAIDAPASSLLNGRNSFEAAIPVRGRSMPQNSLWAVWYGLIGKEVGQTTEEVKRECKLLYGAPILCAESEEFRRMWEAKFAYDNYQQQLFMMRYLPVTSLFSKGQGSIYTSTLQIEYAKQDIVLDVL